MKLRTTHILSLMLIMALILPLQAKDFNQDEIKKNLPKMLGANNVGREFYFSFIPCWETPNQGNDLKLYISSGIRTKVVVEVVEKGYEKIKYTVPNDIIEYTLAPAIGQAYRKTDRDLPEADQVWRGAGIHVKADDPIICYGVTRYQYTSDAFLCVPVPALGKEYIIASFADPADGRAQFLSSYSSITAAYDKTKVRFTMGGTDWSRTAGGLLPGESSNWNLNKGDVLLIAGLGSHAEITGSTVSASKPVGIVSGNFCAYIPTNCGCCDVIEEMELPTNTWGTEYHVTKIIDRKKNSVIKIFAKEAKTKIYRDHNQIGFLRNAGGTEGPGYIYMRADESAPRPVVIGGDKPIGVTQYNTGQGDDGVSSDPFQMILTPIEQYQREIIFNTPGIRGGYGFPKNYLNLCYEATSFGTIPDDLMFAQVIAGQFDWTPLKDMSPQPGDAFVKVAGGKTFYSKTIVLPGDGVYKIKGTTPFAAYSYGFSDYDSYGMPTSVALGDLTRVDTIPPDPPWYMTCDGNVNFETTKPGFVTDYPEDEANRSNMSTIYMHSDLSYNYKLYNNDFMPCEDQVANWKLEVIDNSEDARAVVTFADCAGNDTTLDIEFHALKLRIIPKEYDFGRHSIGQTTEKMFYIYNASETSEASVNYLRFKLKDEKGNPQGFTIWDSTGANPLPTVFAPPIKIAPLDSFPFIVKFNATAEGEFWDSIGVGDTCVFWYKSIATANVGMPIIDVTDWDFPPTMVGSPAFGNFDVKNLGTVSLDITDYQGPFITGIISKNKIYTSTELEEKAITPTTPMVLKPNETATFQVMFIPDEEKSYPDSIVFFSNTIKDEKLNKNNKIDSVCVLTGIGIRSDLTANSYNWGRKRIDRPGTFDIAPYPVVVDGTVTKDSVIKIYNGATAAITITNLKNTATQGDIASFIFNRADLLCTLQPGETKIIPVEFQPRTTGQHLLTIEYTTNPSIPNVTSTLQGIGIVPKIETSDVDFGSTILNDFANSVTKPVKFRNLSDVEWQYGDSVTITDFTETNIYTSITNNWDQFTEPFRYDKDPLAIPFPIVLQPGEEIVFDGEFVAKDGNPVTGSLKSFSDAEAEVTSNWTGDGLLQSASITGDQTTICLGMTDLLDVVLTNTNETNLSISPPTITGADASMFKFVPSISTSFNLPANSSMTFKVQYTANLEGTQIVDVTFKTSALNADSVISTKLTGNCVKYNRTFTIDPVNNGTPQNAPIDIDRFTEKRIIFDPLIKSSDFSLSQLVGFIINIKFNGDFLMVTHNTDAGARPDPKMNGIILGSVFKDYPVGAFDYTIINNNQQTGSLSIEILLDTVKFPGIYFISPNVSELLAISLHTYLPKLDSNQSDFIVSISPIEATGACIDIPSATASLSIDKTCVYDIRKIIVNAGTFGLEAIKPNPVTGDEAVIEFSIANTDCQTRIEVYNSANQLVAVPVDKIMQPGKYDVTVPVTNWASGSYYYIMKAGPYEEQQRMVIVK